MWAFPAKPVAQPDPERVAKAKKNVRFENIAQICKEQKCEKLYDQVLEGVAKNTKRGPFRATSGLSLPYYLNSSTNFLDKEVAPQIAQLTAEVVSWWLSHGTPNKSSEPLLVVGPEVAGGMLACQLAAVNNKSLNNLCDYIYMRKEAKASGTLQQLEGPTKYTSRTAKSAPINALWVDDCMSTGGSLVEGVKLLKSNYNINVTHALFLVDRTIDRAAIAARNQRLADPLLDGVDIKAIFDLEQVDAKVPVEVREAKLPPVKPQEKSLVFPVVLAAAVLGATFLKYKWP